MRRYLDCDHPLSLAVVIYFYQFTIFHGGVYQMFDVFVITLPILFLNRRLLARPPTAALRSVGSTAAPPTTAPSLPGPGTA